MKYSPEQLRREEIFRREVWNNILQEKEVGFVYDRAKLNLRVVVWFKGEQCHLPLRVTFADGLEELGC